MAPIFEAPIFKGYPLIYGVATDESRLQEWLLHPPATLGQTHSNLFVEVTSPMRFEGADGLITRQKQLPLLTRHADCQTLVLYDRKKHLLANIHAGWRGLKAQIYTKVLHYLAKEHNSSPQDLLAAIGPSLGQDNAEYVDGKTLFPESFQPFQKNFHYDLKAIALQELLHCGLTRESIAVSPICTVADTRFHSWRRDKTTARNITFCYLL